MNGGGGQMIVRAPLILAPLGMTPFWIGHTYSSNESRVLRGNSMVFHSVIAIAF